MLSTIPAYAELHCLSNFTFLRGASHPEELVRRAQALGYSALAITDECSLAGVVRAHVAAKEAGLALIIGSEIRLDDGPKLVLLAADREGYGNLSELITTGRRRGKKGGYSLSCADLDDGLPGCLALLLPAHSPSHSHPHPGPLPQGGEGIAQVQGGEGIAQVQGGEGIAQVQGGEGIAQVQGGEGIVQVYREDEIVQVHGKEGMLRGARWLAERFPGRAWIAVELLCGPDDRARLAGLRELGRASGLPLVAAGDVHMHVRSRRRLQDTLTAIRLGRPVSQCGHALYPNAERHLRLRLRLANLYPSELLAETLAVAARCRFSLDSLRYEYPEELVPAGVSPADYLRTLTEEGLRRRFAQGAPAQVRSLVEHELGLIAELRYEPYFLTVHDIVKFARERGILCQGRGSAANSAVCYALGITEVDPARMNMLFERFISRERNEPPDIDVDFEHQRREEVIQYLYGKYGRERAALTATVISYRARSALRDAGKALGLDLQQVDRLSKNLAWWDDRSVLPERLREAGFDPQSALVQRLIEVAGALLRFPRHLSQHVGGFVISRGPLSRLVPIENAAMPDRSVIQWDKDDLDALGLLKIDVLALGMLSAIRRALDMIARRRGAAFGLADIPPEDPAVYEMIGHADTVGVFQVESRAQMSMLPRLKPVNFYDLVIEVAIMRPGPIQGGMVHPYLRRRQGIEPVTYPSDAVKAVLERTLGIPIFQEQVMQLAVVAAGFTPGEADRLRRSMAAWRRKGDIDHFQERLIGGMRERGYPAEFAQRIYQQILGFGEYGFPESHSASFALLVYVSAWIKRHEPAAFFAALLNSQPMGFYSPSQLVQDARRHGVEVRPVDACASDRECTLEEPTALITPLHGAVRPAVRLGLLMVHGLSQAGAERIVAARQERPFESVEDFARRAALNRHDLKCLAAANALGSLSGHRRLARWDVAAIDSGPPVLRDAPVGEARPALPAPTEGENLTADFASLGLTLGRHPLSLLRTRLARLNFSTAEQLRAMPHGQRVRAAGIVTGRQRPDTASGVVFVTLEDETGNVNVVVWRSITERQRRELLGSRLMGVEGELQREGEVVHLVARRLSDHSRLLGRLATTSRNFH